MNKESNPSKTNFYRSLKFQKLESLLSKSKISVDINGLHGSSLSLLIIDLFYKTNKSIMFLCDDESEAKYIHSDLVVTKSRRGNGIGSLLFSKFINHAHSLRVKRIEWAVLDWNVNAIEFYEKNGAKILSDWRVAQMDEDSIKKFCNNESI